MRFFTFDIEWDFPGQKLVFSSKSSSSIWNSVNLFNEIVNAIFYVWYWMGFSPELKLVSSSKSSSSISSSSLKVVSSSKGLPKIGAIEFFGLSIGTIFNDWIFLYFLPKVAWDFRMRSLFLSFRFVSRAVPWSVSGLRNKYNDVFSFK